MYNLLQTIATDNDWHFEYSRKDYQNLDEGLEIDKIHLFVDPIQIDSNFSASGNEVKTYSGKMMLLLSSDVDETYNDKYNNYIKPLINTTFDLIKDALFCSDYQINKLGCVEVINLFDTNLDGLLITYSVTLPY